jgi:hypothetical protein
MKTEQLLDIYIQLRDRRAQRKKAYEAEDEKDKGYQEQIENMFMKRFAEEGITQVKGPSGTAYQSTKTTVSAADKDLFLEFVRKNELWHMLVVKPMQSAVEEYLANHDELPPGVNMQKCLTIGVRRS